MVQNSGVHQLRLVVELPFFTQFQCIQTVVADGDFCTMICVSPTTWRGSFFCEQRDVLKMWWIKFIGRWQVDPKLEHMNVATPFPEDVNRGNSEFWNSFLGELCQLMKPETNLALNLELWWSSYGLWLQISIRFSLKVQNLWQSPTEKDVRNKQLIN